MPEDIKRLWVILILFPGLVSVLVAQYVVGVNNVSDLRLLIYAVGLNGLVAFLSLGLYRLIVWLARLLRRVAPQPEPRPGGWFVVLILLVSVIFGIIAGVLYENDVFLKAVRAFRPTRLVTKRSFQRPLTFLLAQNRKGELEEGRPPSMKVTEAWIEVHLKDGKVFEGWPEFFSLQDGAAEIFISPACNRKMYGRKTKVTPISGPGVLVFEKDIRLILFIDKAKSQCHNIWASLAKGQKSRP